MSMENHLASVVQTWNTERLSQYDSLVWPKVVWHTRGFQSKPRPTKVEKRGPPDRKAQPSRKHPTSHSKSATFPQLLRVKKTTKDELHGAGNLRASCAACFTEANQSRGSFQSFAEAYWNAWTVIESPMVKMWESLRITIILWALGVDQWTSGPFSHFAFAGPKSRWVKPGGSCAVMDAKGMPT